MGVMVEGNRLYISSASMPMSDKMDKLCELTFSPFGPGGPIGPGGPACPCGEEMACEETGKSCLTEGPPWFPARSPKPCVVHPSFRGTHGSWQK